MPKLRYPLRYGQTNKFKSSDVLIEPKEEVLANISEPYYITIILRRTYRNTFYLNIYPSSGIISKESYQKLGLLVTEVFASKGLNIYKNEYDPSKISIMIADKMDLVEEGYEQFIKLIDAKEIRKISTFKDAVSSMILDLLGR